MKTLKKEFKLRKTDLKTWLQDQRYPPSGIGNYLACEICHQAKLSPWLKLNKLSKQQEQDLCEQIDVELVDSAELSCDSFSLTVAHIDSINLYGKDDE